MSAKEATLHIRLDPWLKGELERIGKENDLKLSPVIRQALQEYVDNNGGMITTRINPDKF